MITVPEPAEQQELTNSPLPPLRSSQSERVPERSDGIFDGIVSRTSKSKHTSKDQERDVNSEISRDPFSD